MWNMCAVVVPILIGSLGSIPVCLAASLKTLNIYYSSLIPKLQPVTFLLNSEIFNLNWTSLT